MPGPDDRRLTETEALLDREDPRFARALGAGRPCPPPEYRHARAWLLLAVAMAVPATGLALAHGLLATGLVLPVWPRSCSTPSVTRADTAPPRPGPDLGDRPAAAAGTRTRR
ncbi:DUF3040 domain-containing protein [Streptomyces sp. NPDC019990]|uniref:DUF3040 domain-containing protein n=1 Tax=Streptomyces sp. NPDC019990 TaxID=3154693 RepID=UPI00340E526B